MRSFFRFLLTTMLLLSLSGCGIIDYFYLPPGEDTAQELFEAGNDAMREKDYSAAIGYYTKLKDNFQFSPYALEAELSLGDAYFWDEDWLESIEIYKEFESLHPRHEAIPYVLFNIGVANMNLYPSIDRPITPVEEAYAYFKRIKDSYPDYEPEKTAEYMQKARRLMAEHELFIADFYFRMGKYGSAWVRYKGIVENFKDVQDIHSHAEEKGQAAFIRHRQDEASKVREKREGSWKDWLDWL